MLGPPDFAREAWVLTEVFPYRVSAVERLVDLVRNGGDTALELIMDNLDDITAIIKHDNRVCVRLLESALVVAAWGVRIVPVEGVVIRPDCMRDANAGKQLERPRMCCANVLGHPDAIDRLGGHRALCLPIELQVARCSLVGGMVRVHRQGVLE